MEIQGVNYADTPTLMKMAASVQDGESEKRQRTQEEASVNQATKCDANSEILSESSLAEKHIEQQIEYYQRELDRKKALTKERGLPPFDDLPEDIKENILELAKSAIELGIDDFTSSKSELEKLIIASSLILATSKAQRSLAKRKAERDRMKLKVAGMEEKITKVNEDNEHLKRLLAEQAKETEAMAKTCKQKNKETLFLQQKSAEYKKIIASLEKELEENGYTEEIKHSTLLDLDKEVKALEAKLLPLKTRLDHYADLPPDIELARLKVEETRLEVAKLEKELTDSIDLLHAEK